MIESTNNYDYSEFLKLVGLVAMYEMPFSTEKCWDGLQIKVYFDAEHLREFDDAIIHSGSHGSKQGLLETYNLNDCNGYETAVEVFKGWKEVYDRGYWE